MPLKLFIGTIPDQYRESISPTRCSSNLLAKGLGKILEICRRNKVKHPESRSQATHILYRLVLCVRCQFLHKSCQIYPTINVSCGDHCMRGHKAGKSVPCMKHSLWAPPRIHGYLVWYLCGLLRHKDLSSILTP